MHRFPLFLLLAVMTTSCRDKGTASPADTAGPEAFPLRAVALDVVGVEIPDLPSGLRFAAVEYASPSTGSRIIKYSPTPADIASVNAMGAGGSVIWIARDPSAETSAAKSVVSWAVGYALVETYIAAHSAYIAHSQAAPCLDSSGAEEEFSPADCKDDVNLDYDLSTLTVNVADMDCQEQFPAGATIPNETEIVTGTGTFEGQALNFVEFRMVMDDSRLALMRSSATALEWQLKMWSDDATIIGSEASDSLKAAGTVPDIEWYDFMNRSGGRETTEAMVTLCPNALSSSEVYTVRYWFKWDKHDVGWLPDASACDSGDFSDMTKCDNYFAFDVIPSRRCLDSGDALVNVTLDKWNADATWNCADMVGRVVGRCRTSPTNQPQGNDIQTTCDSDGQTDSETCEESETLGSWSPGYVVRVLSHDYDEIAFGNIATLYCGNGVCDSSGTRDAAENSSNCPEDCSVDSEECEDGVTDPSTGGTTDDPCAGEVSGWYCGSTLAGYEGDGDDLVRCSAGMVAESEACTNSCIVEAPEVNDECADEGSTVPAPPTLSSPVSETKYTTDDSVTFTWGSATGATRYRLAVCADETLASGCSVYEPDTGARTYTLSGATIGAGQRYWAVQSIGVDEDLGWGVYSASRDIRITPPAPALSSPTSGASYAASDSVTFAWGTATSANRYMLAVCSDSTLSTGCTVYEPDTGLRFDTLPAADLGVATWYWAVRAIGSDETVGWGPYSTSWALTVAEAASADADGDGYDSAADCDDHSSTVHPGAVEACNSVDDDCDGSIDEGCPVDGDGDGYNATTDCDDTASSVHPGATETCDGSDNDCDGTIDEGATTTYYRDADGDGYGTSATTSASCSVPVGYVANDDDCNDTSAVVSPAGAEVCDSVDNDCDGSTDESCSGADGDGDGYDMSTDCDDSDAAVNPDTSESCGNSIDDDCDGSADIDCIVEICYEPGVTMYYGELLLEGNAFGYWDYDYDGYGDPAAGYAGSGDTEICGSIMTYSGEEVKMNAGWVLTSSSVYPDDADYAAYNNWCTSIDWQGTLYLDGVAMTPTTAPWDAATWATDPCSIGGDAYFVVP